MALQKTGPITSSRPVPGWLLLSFTITLYTSSMSGMTEITSTRHNVNLRRHELLQTCWRVSRVSLAWAFTLSERRLVSSLSRSSDWTRYDDMSELRENSFSQASGPIAFVCKKID